MLKQILSKLPRKSPKSDQLDASEINSGSISNSSNGSQCKNVGSSLSSRLSVVKRVSSAVFPASIMAGVEAVEPHLSFNDVSNPQKHTLFVSKLNRCCEVSDFSNSNKITAGQDPKLQTLIELADFVSSGSAKFTEPVVAAMCKMFSLNLFRVFPPKCRSNGTGGEAEDDEPMFDPAWSHLQIVYDLLLQFVSYGSLEVKVAKKYVDHLFIVSLLDLFDSEDPRERDCLKTILHRIYGKFMVHRQLIRQAVSNIIYRFVFETERHNGIAELLDIFGSIISGFALPLKEEHRIFLCRALIPLHKPKSLGIYHQQLTYCVIQFIDKDPKLATTVIKGLLKYWPVSNSQKELMFLSELEEFLEMTSMADFQKIMVPLFRRIGCCLNSSHYQIFFFFGIVGNPAAKPPLLGLSGAGKTPGCPSLPGSYKKHTPWIRTQDLKVAERAHLLWNNKHILNLITHNRKVIMPLVFSALERNTQNHWSHGVLILTQNVRKIFCDMDEELVQDCRRKLEEENSLSIVTTERRKLTWERLETAASFQPSADYIIAPVKPAACFVAC